jgi:hypothetical protein
VSDPTYGELLATAEHHLVRAIFATREPFRSAQAAHDAVAGYADLLLALKGSVRTLAGAATPGKPIVVTPPTSSAGRLFHAVDDAASGVAGLRQSSPRGGEWNAAARAMLAATALLETHFGPDRIHHTPDAARVDDPAVQRAELHRLGALALTVADGGRHLALRVLDSAVRFEQSSQLRDAARWLMTTQVLLGEVAAAVVINDDRAASTQAGLSMLRPAPLLAPTRYGDPIATPRNSFDCIRLLAHRQARGELDAGIDAIRAHATVGMLVATHGHAIAAAAASVHRHGSTQREEELAASALALRAVRQPWAQVLNAAENYTTMSRSAPLLAREVAFLSNSLGMLTRDSNRWRSPTEMLPTQQVEQRLVHLVHYVVSRLPDIGLATETIVERLHERGELLVPTRERDDVDVPYRWAPVSPDRLTALRDATREAHAVSTQTAAAAAVLLHASTSLQRRTRAGSSLTTVGSAPTRRSAGS